MVADASSEIKISIENEEEKKMIELIERGQWLRAAILGANDGLLSTTSLMLGVGAAKEDKWLMIISGLAGAVAGACSMAVGEFVSVSTQRDIELQANILNLVHQWRKPGLHWLIYLWPHQWRRLHVGSPCKNPG
ncbi:putative membrane protein [Forsythia ovata]|uniref:Vacuolar iron transporter n=1 Tax=Forsythia ovata TaxID=205694 RepID=A0ABD1VI01_9LAMI